MSWLNKLPMSTRITVSCYLIAALFGIPVLVTFLLLGNAWIGIVLIVVLAICTYPLSRLIEKALTSSFDELASVTNRISKGDFTQRAKETQSASTLSRSFNSMVDKLTHILREASAITSQVMSSSRGIADKNQELSTVMHQVAMSAHELAVGANEISQDVAGMTTAIQEIEQKVGSYAGSTKEMNERSAHTLSLVEQGSQAVEKQAEGMQRNIEATSKVSATIDTLSRNAQGITKITKTISDIAEQTNLLSLNASIEAARAGEHGKGFAVVADEVRKLAEESTRSTREVFELVRNIEMDVMHAIEHMSINEEVVRLQNEMIKESKEIFQQIVQSVLFITEQIESFSKESDTMLESAHQISGAIQNISAITEQSAAGTEQVSAHMNEQIASIKLVAEEAEAMNQAVFQLQKTIHIFKF
ncbi:HAMP domain-containing methyl-accepting chemotaxis protein [Paenibacillus sp. YPG26]|uniref:methyl-accepting chemotaxis protein n=1 Tax=Paenibacillus sp. YPG26 TaxID=2878915 RepID=UPI0020420300|nr:HAMP domain-containing methyl-accepting chemotaxis protein [Paenibacillus sp. YPG26]USB32180.1 methyl-accepting chemotaxis protein [Paenibacillus sp. YPG26]